VYRTVSFLAMNWLHAKEQKHRTPPKEFAEAQNAQLKETKKPACAGLFVTCCVSPWRRQAPYQSALCLHSQRRSTEREWRWSRSETSSSEGPLIVTVTDGTARKLSAPKLRQ